MWPVRLLEKLLVCGDWRGDASRANEAGLFIICWLMLESWLNNQWPSFIICQSAYGQSTVSAAAASRNSVAHQLA
jgi:hypothetical protein